MPPPLSDAVPVIITRSPLPTLAPPAGEVTSEVGARVSGRLATSGSTRPDLQRTRLRAHVGEEVDGRLLHRLIGRVRAAIVVAVEAPRPLHGAGAEDERAARVAVDA